MGKNVPLDGPALDWARGMFARYYRSQEVPPPPRFPMREFAAFPFAPETLMRRHASFRTADEFRTYLRREVPRHVYYSSAYYRQPDHPKMAQKEWLGADLIFDLDADHLRGAADRSYVEQLALVKERVRTLLDDFLFGDFGLDPAATELVFSGGRGYHVHVRSEELLPLTSPERRELVEYVMGVGFDPSTAVIEGRESAANPLALAGVDGAPARAAGGAGARERRYKRLAPAESPGWRGRTTRAFRQLLARWESIGPERAADEMTALGVPPRDARRLARALLEEGRAEQIRTSLSLEVFKKEVPPALLEVLLPYAAVEVQGETDAPVTTDIHRLIRLPRSLHGGSGLRVTPIPLDGLASFDPLRDAVPPGLGDDPVPIEIREPVDTAVGGTRVVHAPGERDEVPPAAALFLVLRGEGVLLP